MKTLFHNAKVITMDDKNTVAKAFVVEDGNIVAVGNADQLEQQNQVAEKVDLQGETVIPGLIDAHSHIEMMAYSWEIFEDCRSSRVKSVEDIVSILADAAVRTEPGKWVFGHGEHFQAKKLLEGRYPDRHDLDRSSTEHPVMYRSSYHLNVFNTKALELLGVDNDTPDAPGGRIERDEHGVATGRTYDMFYPLGGPQAELDVMVEGMKKVQDMYLAVGVTALGEIPLHTMGLEGLLETAKRGELKLRVTAYPTIPNVLSIGQVSDGSLDKRFDDIDESVLRRGGVKFFLDGGLTSSAAALNQDYPHIPGYRGELGYEDEDIYQLIKEADAAGMQIALHAIGDRALDQVLNTFERLRDEGALHGTRHRIEHAGNIWMTSERIERLKALSIIPVPQPAFILTTALGYRSDLGDMIGDLMPFRTLKDEGFPLPGNSDAIGITPDQHNPFYALQAAVERKTVDGQPVDIHQAITVLEAIGMYTRDAAYAVGRETEIGSIEVGKRADFVVLSRDILNIPVSEISQITSTQTWVAGERAYSTV